MMIHIFDPIHLSMSSASGGHDEEGREGRSGKEGSKDGGAERGGREEGCVGREGRDRQAAHRTAGFATSRVRGDDGESGG